MRKYYILRSDGSSIFEEGHCLDFISHCYYLLSEQSEEAYQVIYFDEFPKFSGVQPTRGTGDESPVLAVRHPESILTYILK